MRWFIELAYENFCATIVFLVCLIFLVSHFSEMVRGMVELRKQKKNESYKG